MFDATVLLFQLSNLTVCYLVNTTSLFSPVIDIFKGHMECSKFDIERN